MHFRESNFYVGWQHFREVNPAKFAICFAIEQGTSWILYLLTTTSQWTISTTEFFSWLISFLLINSTIIYEAIFETAMLLCPHPYLPLHFRLVLSIVYQKFKWFINPLFSFIGQIDRFSRHIQEKKTTTTKKRNGIHKCEALNVVCLNHYIITSQLVNAQR